jgi:lysozyme
MDAATLPEAQKDAIALISKLEGLRFQAYLDIAGDVTIGFGSRTDDMGLPIEMGKTCTLAQAENYLNYHLQKYVFPQIKEFDLPPKIYAAISSLIYNVGSLGIGIKNVMALKKWQALPDCFRQYVVVNGRVSEGLKNRREREIDYFMNGDK